MVTHRSETDPMGAVTAIRRMRASDLAAAKRLAAQAGWNQVEDDWRFFLHARPEGCFVAEREGQVVGTVTSVEYGPDVAWISLLLVDAALRRQGIGTRLMEAALESLSGSATVALDATPAGRALYERLGFRPEFELLRLVRPRAEKPALSAADRASLLAAQEDPSTPLRYAQGDRCCLSPVPVDALLRLAALDRAATGADRLALLQPLYARAPEAAWMALRLGRVEGFCLGRHGASFSQLGPVVAERGEAAIAVCRTAIAAWAGRAIVIDVPASEEAFLAWLRGEGFTVQRSFTRMSYGRRLADRGPSGPAHTYAICGPEFG